MANVSSWDDSWKSQIEDILKYVLKDMRFVSFAATGLHLQDHEGDCIKAAKMFEKTAAKLKAGGTTVSWWCVKGEVGHGRTSHYAFVFDDGSNKYFVDPGLPLPSILTIDGDCVTTPNKGKCGANKMFYGDAHGTTHEVLNVDFGDEFFRCEHWQEKHAVKMSDIKEQQVPLSVLLKDKNTLRWIQHEQDGSFKRILTWRKPLSKESKSKYVGRELFDTLRNELGKVFKGDTGMIDLAVFQHLHADPTSQKRIEQLLDTPTQENLDLCADFFTASEMFAKIMKGLDFARFDLEIFEGAVLKRVRKYAWTPQTPEVIYVMIGPIKKVHTEKKRGSEREQEVISDHYYLSPQKCPDYKSLIDDEFNSQDTIIVERCTAIMTGKFLS
eukprot:m.356696 g.356696  ORF g.356696 m.356696 type:complete len:384 (-) comp16605_c2_seq2:835-1986(-)